MPSYRNTLILEPDPRSLPEAGVQITLRAKARDRYSYSTEDLELVKHL